MSFFKRIPYKSIGIYLLKVIALAVIYRLAAVLGLSMAYAQANASPVWPPTGIALAALLLFGVDLWPGVALGVLIGSLLTGAPPLLAFGMALGNTLEAVVGALLLKRLVKLKNKLERLQDVVGILLVSLLSTAISASLGTLAVILSGNAPWVAFGNIWTTWWIGDLLGALVVAPLLLTWLTPGFPHMHWREFVEGSILFVLLTFLAFFVFSNQPPVGILHQALLYVIFPLTIWNALRFGLRGTSIGIVLVSGIAIWSTIHNNGPFALESLNDSLILLQTFTGVVSITSLILAAVTMERHAIAENLRQKVSDLAALNQASEAFLSTSDQKTSYRTICRTAVRRFQADAAWIDIEDPVSMVLQPVAAEGISLQDVPKIMSVWQKQSRSPLHSKSIKNEDKGTETKPHPAFQSHSDFPLVFGNKTLGTLRLLSKTEDFFSKDRQLLFESFANLAAVAIQNVWLLEHVQRGNEQLHALSQRLMKAQEEERLHLSRELHDESGQLLAAIKVQLGLLERDTTGLPDLKDHIQELKRISDDLQDNLHKLAVNLRPASLDHLGLVTALQQYVAEFSRQHDIQVEFETTGLTKQRLSSEVETAVFRVVQESLTNVVSHANASRVDILLSRRNDHLVIVIEDNGVGFLPTENVLEDHLGLFGMRERIEMLNGTLAIESAPGKGTTVKVEVPNAD